MSHLFPYRWKLSDGYPAKGIKYHGRKVFGTFICGGGSTMGYKLAGYDHLGGVEIDPKVAAVYKANNNPKYLFVEDIRAFNERTDLPDELFNLDLLDGSPPCSSFSMAGSREKGWGKAKVFREGQAHQRLDDLVFAYVETIAKLRPKVAILENVKGLLAGNAKAYAKEIVKRLRGDGYTVQVFLLNAATMGVPQMRERAFFIARKEAGWPNLRLEFREPVVAFGKIHAGERERKPLSSSYAEKWARSEKGTNPKAKSGNTFGFMYRASHSKVLPTITSGGVVALPDEPCELSAKEYALASSFPQDYSSGGFDPQYIYGMSVPPVMTAQIAHQINLQWFSKLKDQ